MEPDWKIRLNKIASEMKFCDKYNRKGRRARGQISKRGGLL